MIKYLSEANPTALRGVALLRLDSNAEDKWRLERSVPTIKFLRKRCSKIVVLSQRGRPVAVKISAGQPKNFEKRLSLRKDALTLSRLLNKPVIFIPHFRFQEIGEAIRKAKPGSIFVLENLRFLKGERAGSRLLAKTLASLGDFYVNDAFAVSHRADASVAAITKYLPSYAGFELENEIQNLSRVMTRPPKPLVILLGGVKAHDKAPVVRYFAAKANLFIIGGALANTILKARGMRIGKSISDPHPGENVKKIMGYKNLLLPIDHAIQKGMILDIGPQSIQLFLQRIKTARTIIWNGPMGVVERPAFRRGTLRVARAIVSNRRALTLAGGGETVTFLRKYGLDKKFDFISTGGGAMLEFLAGKKLPGIEALEKSKFKK